MKAFGQKRALKFFSIAAIRKKDLAVRMSIWESIGLVIVYADWWV